MDKFLDMYETAIKVMKKNLLETLRREVKPGHRAMLADALLRATTELALEEMPREDFARVLRTLADELDKKPAV